nr:AAA family ATPase [Candidatus Dependentiae bacterium]
LYGYASKCLSKASAYCKGESYDDGSGYKKSSAKFTDVVGAHRAKVELGSIVDYFKDKKAIDRIGAGVDRSYLLVGPLDTAKSLARSVAGEVSAVLKEQNKSECLIVEIHASSLISKSIKDILKEAESRHTHCIIVLDEIDRLYELKGVKSQTWSDLISAMNGLSKSKKDIFVITTATKADFATQASVDRYGVYCSVENPTAKDRSNYFAQELKKRAVVSSSFDLESVARKSEGCTFTQLTTMLKRALAKSHTFRGSLSQDILEKSVTEVMKAKPVTV